MSFLARRTASVEGAYFYQESKLAVSRLVEKNKKNNPNFASSLNSSISVVENETQADVLPEILKHSLPSKISEPFSESSISTASKWNLPRDVSKVHSLSTEAINPFGSYIALPQVTLGPKRWRFPEGENSVFASTANDLRTDKYNIYGDAEKLKAISAGISRIGASFAIATAVVFGGAALAFGITASKLDIHNSNCCLLWFCPKLKVHNMFESWKPVKLFLKGKFVSKKKKNESQEVGYISAAMEGDNSIRHKRLRSKKGEDNVSKDPNQRNRIQIVG
ncbi:hypothetical protein MKW98_024157 [Papaver atlanticum]|uniref:Uncharacterized protein n=1 Tax=Papaver atlanticum TaxID=357466 RepID=A0AAD4SZQ5_9MAGN|nr:hypothetical protein MKW98_024157 [Papaver atlanticum]